MMAFKPCILCCLVLVASLASQVGAFVGPTRHSFAVKHNLPRTKERCAASTPLTSRHKRPTSTSTTSLELFPSIARPAARPVLALVAVFLTSYLVSFQLGRRGYNFLYPNLKLDETFPDLLPPAGPLGCPWFGNNPTKGNQRLGADCFYRERSRWLGDPLAWMYYFKGRPVTNVRGVDLMTKVNNMEFLYTHLDPKRFAKSYGLAVEFEREMHSALRRLVGQAFTPQAMKDAVPALQKAAQQILEEDVVGPATVISSIPITMHEACEDFSLETVHTQLLGIDDLTSEEVPVVREILRVWLAPPTSRLSWLGFGRYRQEKRRKKAQRYLESLIEGQMLKEVKKEGQISTVAKLLNAAETLESGEEIDLTNEQVIDNTLGLIKAGVKPTAGILTLSMLLLGIHKDKYRLLVKEQQALQNEHGYQLTYDLLDVNNSPCLNAIVQEALRMGAGTKTTDPKIVASTIVVDGKQIPRGTMVLSNYRLTHQLDSELQDPDDTHMDPYHGFQPERWLAESKGEPPRPAEYCPFGVGPRTCLGAPLAMLQLKVFLALFARRIEAFDLVHGQTMDDDETPGTSNIHWDPQSLIPEPKDGVEIMNIKVVGPSQVED